MACLAIRCAALSDAQILITHIQVVGDEAPSGSTLEDAEDEGLMDAAELNNDVQRMYAALSLPEVCCQKISWLVTGLEIFSSFGLSFHFPVLHQVYRSLGLSEPPKSYTPLDLEIYTQSMRIVDTAASSDPEGVR